jgi:hypothetical protein
VCRLGPAVPDRRGSPLRVPRWAGIPFAVAFALYLPQFFGPPALRIAHGVLVALGCVLLAAVMRRSGVLHQRDAGDAV